MLFAKLKIAGYSIELVSEYVKAWAIAKRAPVGFDQVYLMGKQLQYEYRFLSNGIQNVITDSPVLLSACYTRAYYPELANVADHMDAIILEYEKQHPAINIFIDRGDKEYKTEGRYQTQEAAQKLDGVVRDTLERLNLPYTTFSFFDNDAILNHITAAIDDDYRRAEAKRIADGIAWIESLSDLDRKEYKERARKVYDPDYVKQNPTS
jgi:hypothetical protein